MPPSPEMKAAANPLASAAIHPSKSGARVMNVTVATMTNSVAVAAAIQSRNARGEAVKVWV